MRTGQPAAPWARLAAIAALYVSLGAVLGFVQGGVGPIMRGKGHALTSMAPVFALYLPFGVTFLWAPLVDRWRLPWLGRRSGWIVAAQGLAVLLVAAIALGGALPLAALFGLGLAATLAVATMDVALDAWTVEHIADAHRGAASAAKVGGLSLGAVLGGGVLVGLFPHLGWEGALLLLAALMAFATLPAWRLPDHAAPAAARQARPGLRAALRQPAMAGRLLRISLVTCALMALFNLNRLMLVDLGVPLARIGWVLGGRRRWPTWRWPWRCRRRCGAAPRGPCCGPCWRPPWPARWPSSWPCASATPTWPSQPRSRSAPASAACTSSWAA
ncbi:MFS transporter [Achromobacter xylosoxidans]